MSDWPFHGLQREHYGVIYADPPWKFEVRSGSDDRQLLGLSSRRTEKFYPTMRAERLSELPVADLGKSDCVLFMWVVDTHLDQAIELGRGWGFKFKTRAFEWLKVKKSGEGRPIGLGFWTRKQAESCLLFTRGFPKRKAADVPQVIEEQRRAHSQKPDETYRRIERLVEGPYCELFARQRWPGWDGWGRDYPGEYEESVRRLTAAIDLLCENLGAI